MREILIVILSSTLGALVVGIFDLIKQKRQFKTQKEEHENKIDKELSDIKNALRLNEKDNLRTQLLVFLKDYPYETTDILRLAEHYFKDLKGNWVLSDIFSHWAKDKNVELPNWFKGDNIGD